MLGICKYLTVLTFVFSFSAILLFHYLGKFVVEVFRPGHILTSLLIFVSLQLFLDGMSFVTSCQTKDHRLSSTTRDRIPIYFNLLRLEYSPFNRAVTIH